MIFVVFGNFGDSLVLVRSYFPLLEGGNAVRFCHFVFSGLARCLLSFFSVLLFLGSLFGKIFRERTFVFGYRCGSCLFWCCFAYVFALWFGFSSPNRFRENSLLVRSVFLNKFLGANFCCYNDRQPYCHFFSCPPSRRGKCCPFFLFLCFCVWFGVFCRFFLPFFFSEGS